MTDSNNNPIFPDEILLEIFIRLPVKSIGKCKSLSKSWQTNISTKHFINTHLKKNNQQEKLLFINKNTGFLNEVTLPMKIIKKVNLGYHEWVSVLGSCNGLVLLQEQETGNIFVSNPVTRKQVQIPFPVSHFKTTGFNQMYGFGYDSSCDDYKVVKLTERFYPDKRDRCYFVDVYSLKSRVWRKVVNVKGPFDDHKIVESDCDMPFVNGVLHWTVTDYDSMYHVHAFDLSTETFREVQVPIVKKRYGFNCMVLKGCLSVETVSKGELYRDVWMMKEYGDVDSWERFRFYGHMLGKVVIPICFVGEDELLSVGVNDRNRWVLCDMTKGEVVEKIAAGRIPFSIIGYSNSTVFIESLVSPEQGNAEE